MQRHKGNVSHAAKEAGLSRNALYALMKRVGYKAEHARAARTLHRPRAH
ncbi:MAG: hypothetical protein H6730_22010 [Deltaproteobacteria bacterium]|nr:hypothetical protein [Deltaproteobacteria bacterium]